MANRFRRQYDDDYQSSRSSGGQGRYREESEGRYMPDDDYTRSQRIPRYAADEAQEYGEDEDYEDEDDEDDWDEYSSGSSYQQSSYRGSMDQPSRSRQRGRYGRSYEDYSDEEGSYGRGYRSQSSQYAPYRERGEERGMSNVERPFGRRRGGRADNDY